MADSKKITEAKSMHGISWLVGMDNSEASRHALDHCISLARDGDEVMAHFITANVDEVEDTTTKVRKSIDECKKDLVLEIIVDTIGKPKTSLVDTAKRRDVDYLVVGSRGLTGLKKITKGSVSSYLVKESPCPVLVVREDVPGPE